MKKKGIHTICCYCGIREATTKDHVPPKAIFNKPRPNDLITVPCCFDCNNAASVSDEKFKTYLGIHVARKRGEAERFFKEGVIATAKHNNSLRHKIFDSMYSVPIMTKEGVIDSGMAVPWDNDAHGLTIERITKGLFFHHYGKVISKNIEIRTYWLKELPKNLSDNFYINSIANGAFVYRYNKVEEADFDSAWLFAFYEGHFAAAIILTSETMPGS